MIGERFQVNEIITLEVCEGGRVKLELAFGGQVVVSMMPAHEAHRLAALITRASLETLHRVVPPPTYDLAYTMSSRGTSLNMDTAALLAAVHEELVAKPARAALELARSRRKGDK